MKITDLSPKNKKDRFWLIDESDGSDADSINQISPYKLRCKMIWRRKKKRGENI